MKHTDDVKAEVRALERDIASLNDAIWDCAEIGFNVKVSADTMQSRLEAEGFKVERGVAGIPDAFVATYGSGGPVIGLLAEYDALPGLSQKRCCPTQSPLVDGAPGHGCGHCSLAAGIFGAAVTVKRLLERGGTAGELRVYGCPAEENGWAKAFMARDGIFDDLDSALTWHPQSRNFVFDKSSLAVISILFHFKGVSAHAAGDPENGRSALDACELMNVGVNYLREHIIPEARVHYAYLDVGGTAPNVVQSTACLHYFVRAPQVRQALEIAERVKDVARGAALMTQTELTIDVVSGMSNLITNDTLNSLLYEAYQAVGAPRFSDDERALAASFYKELSDKQKQIAEAEWMKLHGEVESLHRSPLREDLMPYVKPAVVTVDPGSSDIGDVSYITPTAQIYVAASCAGTSLHSWNMTGQSGSPIAHRACFKAAEVLALTCLKLYDEPSLLEAAKAELRSITGGVYPCPIPDGVRPPLGPA